jgi:DNA-binding CsgD family transcriptional regulator
MHGIDQSNAVQGKGELPQLIAAGADFETAVRDLIRPTGGDPQPIALLDLQWYLAVGLGQTYGRTGRLGAALSCFDDALDSARLTGRPEQRALSQGGRAWILAWTGDLAGAGEAATEALRYAGSGYAASVTRYRVAEVRNCLGDQPGCIKLMVEGCGGPGLSELDPVNRLRAMAELATAEAARGNTAAATSWAEAAAEVPAAHSGFADYALAVALAGADPAAALRHADAATDAFGRVDDLVYLGRAHLVAARSLDRPAAARMRYGMARNAFRACGASLFLRQADREQRRMNAQQPRRKSSSGSPGTGLTPREQEIAQLVTAGLTNRQIAERLFLSPRTVESHVSRLFARLNVSSRTAMVHALHGGAR